MIPEKIKIGAIPYAVSYPPDLDTKLTGEIDYLRQTIKLRAQMGAETTRVVLLHEVVHGMLFALGYYEHDEKLVDGLAHMLAQVSDENPALFIGSK